MLLRPCSFQMLSDTDMITHNKRRKDKNSRLAPISSIGGRLRFVVLLLNVIWPGFYWANITTGTKKTLPAAMYMEMQACTSDIYDFFWRMRAIL